MLTGVRTRWNFRRALRLAAQGSTPRAPGGRDIVLVPCWRRPEFLWHCLDNLVRVHHIDSVHVVFRPDTGFAPENLEVIRAFGHRLPSYEVQLPERCPYRRTKQSANVLLGYLHAAAAARRHVFLLEEDVMVARDFLSWHRAVHAAAGPLFCSIAVNNPHRPCICRGEPEGYYLCSDDYCSYGVCFDRGVLRALVAPHVQGAYLRRPKHYLRRHFPASRVGLSFVEQDGLIRRIQESSRLPIAYPCLPRAYDAGFYGYNRPGGIAGPVHSRRARLGEIIYDRARLRALTAPEFANQCVPIDLEPPAWRVQRRIEPVPATAAVTGSAALPVAAPLPGRAA
jgi:hypothetical protein